MHVEDVLSSSKRKAEEFFGSKNMISKNSDLVRESWISYSRPAQGMNSPSDSRSYEFQTSNHKSSPLFECIKPLSQEHPDGSWLEYQILEIEHVYHLARIQVRGKALKVLL